MNNFSEITTIELKSKEEKLISETETLRLKLLRDLNVITKNCEEIKIIQLELEKRNGIASTS